MKIRQYRSKWRWGGVDLPIFYLRISTSSLLVTEKGGIGGRQMCVFHRWCILNNPVLASSLAPSSSYWLWVPIKIGPNQ